MRKDGYYNYHDNFAVALTHTKVLHETLLNVRQVLHLKDTMLPSIGYILLLQVNDNETERDMNTSCIPHIHCIYICIQPIFMHVSNVFRL
jgi:hypothetical protein